MKTNSLIISVFAVLAATLFSSCSHRIVDFTVISSRNVPIVEQGTEFKKATQRVKGEDSKWSILFVPGIPNMKEAIDRAIDKYPGAVALTDGVVYAKSWTVGLFGQNKYIVEGTPLYTQAGVDAYNSNTNRYGNQLQNNYQYQQQQPVYNQYQQQPVYNQYQQQPATVPQQSADGYIFTHSVKQGETLDSIAQQYNVSVRDIIQWNQLTSTNLTNGMQLRIQLR